VELQTGVAQLRMDGISSSYRDNLLDCVSAKYRARSGKML
jgi:hypothetical protein